MKKYLLIFLILLFSISAQAAQSLTLNGSSQYASRTMSNSSPFTSVGAWRLEMRLTNLASNATYRLVDNDHFYVQLNTTSGELWVFSWDGEITDAPIVVFGFNSHLTDLTLRVQRDTTNSRYTVEAWDSSSTTRWTASTGAA